MTNTPRMQLNPDPLGVTTTWRAFVRNADLYSEQIGTVQAADEEQALHRAKATWPDTEWVLPS